MKIQQCIKNGEPQAWQIILLLVVLQLGVALLSNGFALSNDEAMWHYIGRNWFRNGLVPYSGGADNKSPLVFALFGLSDMLFGVNYWFPRLFGTAFQTIGIYYVYRIAYYVTGKQAAIAAISFYGLSLLWHCADGKYVSYTETYEVTFVIIACYFYLTHKNNKSLFLSGFLSAIGLGFRVSAVFGIATLFFALLRKGKVKAVVFCAGVFTGIGLIAAIFALAGIDLKDVFTYTLTDNFGTGSTTDHTLLWRLEQAFGMFFYSEMVLFYPFVLIYWYKKRMDWLLLWLVLEFVGINIIGNYARVQLKEILPPLSLISAFAVAHLIKTYKLPQKAVLVMMWICFFPKLVEPFVNIKKLFIDTHVYTKNASGQPDEGGNKLLGLRLKEHTAASDKVFVAGFGAQVQIYSERISPTIYFNVTQTALAKKKFFCEMNAQHPQVILIPLFPEYTKYVNPDLRLFIQQLANRSYYLDACLYGYNIYRIKKQGQPRTH